MQKLATDSPVCTNYNQLLDLDPGYQVNLFFVY
jgi:hypothetical protein